MKCPFARSIVKTLLNSLRIPFSVSEDADNRADFTATFPDGWLYAKKKLPPYGLR